MKKYSLAVVIGRFQPFHDGHHHLIKEAKELADKVLVLVGSANASRSPRNPFTYEERADMIWRGALSHPEMEDWMFILPLNDHYYDDEAWLEEAQEHIEAIRSTLYFLEKPVVMVGHDKDSTSYYQHLFPQYDSVNVENHGGIDATTIRDRYFLLYDSYTDHLPNSSFNFLAEFAKTKNYVDLTSDYVENLKYKDMWSNTPYPVIFTTVDAVVVCSGHILVVRRGQFPGKGLLALPGGFINPDETLLSAAIRELKEETRLKMPIPAIKGVLKNQHVFDHPQRSMRGRTITHGFFFHLEPGKLPEVRGSDDADEAFWLPLSKLEATDFFEDHYHIIRYFV